MNIIEALKTELDVRVSHEDRWMVWDSVLNLWVVYQHRRYAKNTVELIHTKSEHEAVKILIKGELGNGF